MRAEVALEGADVLEALVPDLLGDQLRRQLLLGEELRVHAHDQRLLVVAAVEDADAAALGQALHAAPEVVVVEILAGRRLEGVDLAALRVDAGHDVLDRAVLAGRVHRLEDQQHRPAVLRVEHVLQLGERLDARRRAPPWRAACPRRRSRASPPGRSRTSLNFLLPSTRNGAAKSRVFLTRLPIFIAGFLLGEPDVDGHHDTRSAAGAPPGWGFRRHCRFDPGAHPVRIGKFADGTLRSRWIE